MDLLAHGLGGDLAKAAIINIRVEEELKTGLEVAAHARGQSLTRFILDAAMREAAKKPPKSRRFFQGVPTFFRAACFEAGQGGSNGYHWAGVNLARALAGLVEAEDDDEKEAKLEELARLLDAGRRYTGVRGIDQAEVIAWFEREFPRCIELVPPRRRSQFIRGLKSAHEEHNSLREW